MSPLEYVDAATGDVFDTVTLGESGELTFATGSAEPLFTSWRERLDGDAAATYRLLSDWSNGYAAVRPAASPAP